MNKDLVSSFRHSLKNAMIEFELIISENKEKAISDREFIDGIGEIAQELLQKVQKTQVKYFEESD